MSNSGVSLTIPCGDYGFDINFELTDADCAAFNVSTYTVKLKVWRAGKPKDLLLNGTCGFTTDGSDGLVYYTVVDGNFSVAGDYLGEIQATKSGVRISWQTFDIVVSESPTA